MRQTRVRLWTVNEYYRMFETGIIAADERVELLDGQLSPSKPPGYSRHIGTPIAGMGVVRGKYKGSIPLYLPIFL
ncbi:hypothetical protein GTQ43_21715 [Nostoc sp. KVJ3]|uniref:hypothetical protein n=1 Tax=Nostoc sp. KVJ3 TaxID=457945 RepID=UPI00223A683A|nr:hypothetical protein [Nostoc sp. KVJ3]MCW5316339.1 hypothetical protein [Nostoc sp. KVJ3]